MSFLAGLAPGLGGAAGGAAAGAAAPMSQAVMGFKSVPMGAAQKPDLFHRILGGIGDGLQQQGQGQGIPDAPMQQNDPFALLRSLGIDLNSNYLGRLGGR